jgi:hypothetical protein
MDVLNEILRARNMSVAEAATVVDDNGNLLLHYAARLVRFDSRRRGNLLLRFFVLYSVVCFLFDMTASMANQCPVLIIVPVIAFFYHSDRGYLHL